jgi:hypothetical protein
MATKLGLEERFSTQDGPRTISFVGWQLGEADSRPNGEQPARWTELRLFKTLGGQYILEKVGCSDVFHNESCPTEPGKPRRGKRWDSLWDAVPEDEADEYTDLDTIFVPCDKCRPDFEDQPVWVEKDIYSTSTYSTAAEVLEALYRPDTRNTASKYLSRVARSLLDQAIEKDDALREVLSAPVEVD